MEGLPNTGIPRAHVPEEYVAQMLGELVGGESFPNPQKWTEPSGHYGQSPRSASSHGDVKLEMMATVKVAIAEALVTLQAALEKTERRLEIQEATIRELEKATTNQSEHIASRETQMARLVTTQGIITEGTEGTYPRSTWPKCWENWLEGKASQTPRSGQSPQVTMAKAQGQRVVTSNHCETAPVPRPGKDPELGKSYKVL
ncbi:uncharacterized protein LOC119965011 [Scyliorhinus canicula]|uniref:uncharacterized protein LOC119965011 n=1 Tax=Scyliorhinus canicula TaxID=7830 RepID=UPI0018F7225D|nr:uncharacterized protein LOC119965011 [Scyliorhinus canicula]